jgi:hypothetical protein
MGVPWPVAFGGTFSGIFGALTELQRTLGTLTKLLEARRHVYQRCLALR